MNKKRARVQTRVFSLLYRESFSLYIECSAIPAGENFSTSEISRHIETLGERPERFDFKIVK